MDVQLGVSVWKVVPRAEVFVHRRYCWLGFVAQKRFTCPRKKLGLNRARTQFSADFQVNFEKHGGAGEEQDEDERNFKSGAGRVIGILSQIKRSTNCIILYELGEGGFKR